jgi:hypothetical protein
MKFLIMQLSPSTYHFLLLGPNILLSTLFSNTLGLCSSLDKGDQDTHPYRTTCKIIVLYILIFMFLDSRREDRCFSTRRQQALPEFHLLVISSLLKFLCCSQTFEMCHIFKGSISCLYVMILLCLLVILTYT